MPENSFQSSSKDISSKNSASKHGTKNTYYLFIVILVIATCGLIYELIAGSVASYLLGDSVTQFSIIIGIYLSSMGVGSYISKFIEKNVTVTFINIELLIAIIGGLSAFFLFFSFPLSEFFQPILYLTVFSIGILVGLEIPLLLRILQDELEFKDLVAKVLSFDYVGALIASIMFPLFFVPKMGLLRTSAFFGLLNAIVALWSTFILEKQLKLHEKSSKSMFWLRSKCIIAIIILIISFFSANKFTRWMESQLYANNIIYATTSSYQRIVITKSQNTFQLFLNGNLQFNSSDEYRYHEALVHPAFSKLPKAKRILVCGGGDGLAVREILKHKDVESITVIDLDPEMTNMGKTFPLLTSLNNNAFNNEKVKIINDDAMIWLQKENDLLKKNIKTSLFDIAIVDFPDPNNFALGKLYTTRFYNLLKNVLSDEGIAIIQSTSPLFARKSFWCIDNTIANAGLYTLPYHLPVPSFGVWGFVMASKKPLSTPNEVLAKLKYINKDSLNAMFLFPNDMAKIPTEVNRLNNQILIQYYDSEWKEWN